MKLIGILTFLLPVYIYAQSAQEPGTAGSQQAQAQPPEPTPPQPELPDTTLVGTKKQTKEAKKKADKKMKEAEKKAKAAPHPY